MVWKEGTKIAKLNGQVQLRKDLKQLIKKLKINWLRQEDVKDELTNIILDYWGSMGPDCSIAWLEAA